MKTKQLLIKQIDDQLDKWRQTKTWFRPQDGWIKTIRKTLGMTTKQLANRLGVDRSRVIRIESDETKHALTIKTITSVADALNCDFVYALVPRKPIKEMVEEQAYKIASSQINTASYNMSLENQALSVRQNEQQTEELKSKLLEGSQKKLWSDE